jgi:inhibitor of the pro-sigma K processing machinery
VLSGVLFNSLIGAAILFVLNLIGLKIEINWFTSIIVGVLGIPGVVLLVILKLIFKIF